MFEAPAWTVTSYNGPVYVEFHDAEKRHVLLPWESVRGMSIDKDAETGKVETVNGDSYSLSSESYWRLVKAIRNSGGRSDG